MLNQLTEINKSTTFQETTLTTDMLGRSICAAWPEVANNGGLPFDVVVIGSGLFGAYCAEKLYRFGDPINLRILVLDAGSFVATTHLQNLPKIDVSAGPLKRVTSQNNDPGPQRGVWGYPWSGNEDFPGLAYCLGGRSLYWGGWSPRLTDADLAQWPKDTREYLTLPSPNLPNGAYARAEDEMGVAGKTHYLSGDLYTQMHQKWSGIISNSNPAKRIKNVDALNDFNAGAPLAIQGIPPGTGLFSFDKYSSANLLIDAVREDIQRRWTAPDDNSRRRLMIVPRVHVTWLERTGNRVTKIHAFVNGQYTPISAPLLSDNCRVVIATSTIESTRLALQSFPTNGMGSNLMAHLRSNTTVRIKRSLFPLTTPDPELETAALLVRGSVKCKSNAVRRFHLQVTAAATTGSNPEKNMFSQIPDMEQLDTIRKAQSQDWIVLVLRGIGEIGPDQRINDAPDGPKDPTKNWMNLGKDADQRDQYGMQRAWVNLVWNTPDNNDVWDAMDVAALECAQRLADVTPDPSNPGQFINGGNIQYLWDGKWQSQPPPPSTDPYKWDNKVRDKVGSTHHEAGTLWMGAAGSSITNENGRFHHVDNVYVAGPALFPTLGSANPSATGIALARKTAKAIVQDFTVAPSGSFKSLFNGNLSGWQMAGAGGFNVFGNTLEAFGGLGLLWYTREEFENFVLRVEWRANDAADNSGVFLRFPALNSSDAANDWKLAVDNGYEVQIDDKGVNPDNGGSDALHQTGAIYALAGSSSIASKPVGQWNRYQIEATATDIKVTLNGQLVTTFALNGSGRPKRGHIGLQNHGSGPSGSRVQFRNLEIKSL